MAIDKIHVKTTINGHEEFLTDPYVSMMLAAKL